MNLHQIGQILKEAREKQQISLQEIAEHTQIRRAQLEALEQGDESKLPAQVYVKGFIKAYGKAIQFDTQKMLSALSPEEYHLDVVQPMDVHNHFGQNFSLIHLVLSMVIVFFIGLIVFIRSALENYEFKQSTINSSLSENFQKSISGLKFSTEFNSAENPTISFNAKGDISHMLTMPDISNTDNIRKNFTTKNRIYSVKDHPLYLKMIEKKIKRHIPGLGKLKKSNRNLQSTKEENSLASVNENQIIGDESIEIEEKILEKIERENKPE